MESKKIIVIIGGASFIMSFLKNSLVSKGFEVFLADKGEFILHANKFDPSLEPVGILDNIAPDLFVLDIDLDDTDGLYVLKTIKAHSDFKKIPVIVNSGKNSKDMIIKAVSYGAADYVIKNDDYAKTILEKIGTFFPKVMRPFETTLKNELEWIRFGKKELAFALVVLTQKGSAVPVKKYIYEIALSKLNDRMRHYDWVFPLDNKSIAAILPLTTMEDLVILRRRLLEHFSLLADELGAPIDVQIGFSHYPSNAKTSKELIEVARGHIS